MGCDESGRADAYRAGRCCLLLLRRHLRHQLLDHFLPGGHFSTRSVGRRQRHDTCSLFVPLSIRFRPELHPGGGLAHGWWQPRVGRRLCGPLCVEPSVRELRPRGRRHDGLECHLVVPHSAGWRAGCAGRSPRWHSLLGGRLCGPHWVMLCTIPSPRRRPIEVRPSGGRRRGQSGRAKSWDRATPSRSERRRHGPAGGA